MWGAGEFTATGLLRDYDRTDRLGELKLPVLFLAGRHDEAVPETVADFQRRVPGRQDDGVREQRACDVPDRDGGVRADRARVSRGSRSERNGGGDAGGRTGPRSFSAAVVCRQRKHAGCRLPMPCWWATRSYVSTGRGGVDLATMQVPKDVKDEVKLMMEDYKAILALAGMTMDDLVSVTIYSPDLNLYSTFNEIYRTYFTKGFPARALRIGSGPLLFGMRFEMQAMAIKR